MVNALRQFNKLFSLIYLCIETGPIDPVLIERYNSPGFIGCLSRVQFNGVAPLKSALRKAADSQADSHPASASPVSYQGKLVQSNCGASPLTIPPMSAAPNPWPLDNTGRYFQNKALSCKHSLISRAFRGRHSNFWSVHEHYILWLGEIKVTKQTFMLQA